MRKVICYVISILFSIQIYAKEELLFTQISTKDGLSQNTVRSVLVDKKGYLWFGTLDGLVRYDGSRFITHKPKPGVNTNLSDQRIREISEDSDGYLWIRTYDNSFSCYDPNKEQFIEFRYRDVKIPLLYTNYVETAGGDIWLWGDNGCIKIQKNAARIPEVSFQSDNFMNKLSQTNVNFIFQDRNNTSWVCCSQGLNSVSESGEITQYYNKQALGEFRNVIEEDGILYFLTGKNYIFRYDILKQKFLSSFQAPNSFSFLESAFLNEHTLLISTRERQLLEVDLLTGLFTENTFASGIHFSTPPQIIQDASNNLWIYDQSGRMLFYNTSTCQTKNMQLVSNSIAEVIDDCRYNIFTDTQGICWITTYGNGLYRYNVENDELVNYTYKKGFNSPASDYLLSITEDHFGNIWIGCEYTGVIKVTKRKFTIEYIKPEETVSIGTGNNVRVVHQDRDKKIWLGTKNGSLYLYDADFKFKELVRKSINPYTIMEDVKGRLWVGTKGNGIYVFSRENHQLLYHFSQQANENSLCNNSIFDIIQDDEGRIWVASFGGGLDQVEETNGIFSFRHFLNHHENKGYLRCLLQDSKGIIWAGSYGGLISFDPAEVSENPEAYTVYTYNPGHSVGLNCNDIKTIYEDQYEQLWIGTAGGGLNLLDKNNPDKQGAFVKYTKDEGLPSNIVTSILEGEDGALWVSTENGLAHFEPDKNTFLAYQFSNTSYGNFYSENTCLLQENGKMLWGTLDGLLVLDPSDTIVNNAAPKVLLTDMFVFDQRLEIGADKSPLKKSIGIAKEVVLKHDQNTFTIHFSCLDLTDPLRNKYSYNLESYDQYWSLPANNNWARYKNMPDGEYVFKVRGSNADGQWNEELTSCRIVILPPPWKSTYAILFYALCITMLMFVFFRFLVKINSLNNAVKMEKQLTNYKLRFFTNISHEFRTPLTLIKGAIERMIDMKALPLEVEKNVALLSRNTLQMSRLIDQLLEFRKLQNNVLTLNLEKTDIRDFALNAYYTFKESAFQKKIDYVFEGIQDKWDLYIDRNKVEKILFNLLSNAFKFTPVNGKITCRITKDPESGNCIICVADSGVGIPKDKRDLLFSRFMKLNFTAEGTGIGLELVKEFTLVHKGTVNYSPNPQGGSIFTVELPSDAAVYTDARFIEKEDVNAGLVDQAEYNEDHAINRPATPRQWKILIIDDNYDIREYLKEELTHHCNVDVAEDGKIGLEKALTLNPSLIICDVKMPEMDGLELTRKLKDNFETSHIPVILLTALSSEAIKLQGSECGADEYIMKPFSLKYLISRVYALIEQREKLKKRFCIDMDVKKGIISAGEKDQRFFELINDIVDKNLSDPDFTVTQFTKKAKLSRTIFYKKVKGLTGYSPNDLIKIKRMKKAAELLLESKYNVSEVSWRVGIEDPFYFSKCFKAQFGCAPSKYGAAVLNDANDSHKGE
ncbi:hybrid sensor histidine kinase/response regulator [Saccharicrinis fermentans]|uniref:histidine kinase n=1 Tax=Saccharicrinis fermentans DSM 9555 = JCM 21142 TaxID=869213 RepID=W7YHS5_9BACT|nr:two-component regulator propeller domain-containing protein [Saccharicrinis fermentans]GAF02104.1 sensory/regulatory protein RpfC [Saccharicrinis fermentans DSM 9555 = JCM 21142]